MLSRWRASLAAFTRAFPDDVGAEHRSFMVELSRFSEKEARFRKEMERLRNASRLDLALEVCAIDSPPPPPRQTRSPGPLSSD